MKGVYKIENIINGKVYISQSSITFILVYSSVNAVLSGKRNSLNGYKMENII